MAALYLHHALFTPEPPLLQQRNPNSDTEPLPDLPALILRSMSSVSAVTLRTSDTFKASNHSESLLDPVSPEATTAFLDIPITSPRDPDHPPDSGSGWLNGPRLERDLSRASNGRWPLDGIWRRLRRLKLLYALSFTVIGAMRPVQSIFNPLIAPHSRLGGLQHDSILPIISWLHLSTETDHLPLPGHLHNSLFRCSHLFPSPGSLEPLRLRRPLELNRIYTRQDLALFGFIPPCRAGHRQPRPRDLVEDLQRSSDDVTR